MEARAKESEGRRGAEARHRRSLRTTLAHAPNYPAKGQSHTSSLSAGLCIASPFLPSPLTLAPQLQNRPPQTMSVAEETRLPLLEIAPSPGGQFTDDMRRRLNPDVVELFAANWEGKPQVQEMPPHYFKK